MADDPAVNADASTEKRSNVASIDQRLQDAATRFKRSRQVSKETHAALSTLVAVEDAYHKGLLKAIGSFEAAQRIEEEAESQGREHGDLAGGAPSSGSPTTRAPLQRWYKSLVDGLKACAETHGKLAAELGSPSLSVVEGHREAMSERLVSEGLRLSKSLQSASSKYERAYGKFTAHISASGKRPARGLPRTHPILRRTTWTH